jgi:hypothetical protein
VSIVSSFIQIVEYETDRGAEVDARMRAAIESGAGQGQMTHLSHTRDHDNPNHYFTVVEFPSYEAAMANSSRPETTAMAKELEAMCTTGPRYRNLDVLVSAP